MKTDTSVKITMKARAFSEYGPGTYKMRVDDDDDGTIRVWDSIAGCYTICHVLSESAQKRARRIAAIEKGRSI